MNYLTFTSTDSAANESAFNDVQARIDALKGYPNANTTTWATPTAHPTQDWCAIPIDDSCLAALTDAEKAAVQTYEQMQAAGWFPAVSPAGPPKTPWWGFLVFWR